MMMGVAVYAITSSPMSLIMVAFSPMMMIGSWLDGMLGGRRKFTREVKRFRETLTSEHVDLSERGAREITVRAAETPTLSEVGAAIEQRGALLWTRRPEHRSFLEVRFGEGSLPSRTELQLPSRGESQAEHWRELQQLADAHRHVAPVPVLERLDRCGSIGVAGDPLWAEGMARSLVLQLIGLHSPTEVVLSCFAGPQHDREWGWLKWVPHVDPVGSPISSWQLADSSEGSLRLVLALEALLEARTATGGGATAAGARSHLDAGARNDAGHGEAVDALPTLPAVIVLVLESTLVDQSRLIALAEHGPDAGIHVIWVAHRTAQLPAACRTFVEFGAPSGGAVGAEAATSARVGFVRSGTTVALERVEFVEQATAARLARVLAPIEDTAARGLDESDLPRSVDLRELHQTDLLGGGGPILRSWQQSGSLVSTWRSGEDREPVPLTAVVGQSPDGPATIDLRVHGPHALVGGTTGAGKSEFLQSWIMSLAAGISPDRLTFLLVDYKGGAAFAECAELPHTVGLVTDLSPHLVRRALTSLRAELKYR
ncbi:MAG: cell division protein FtsK, partial [Actinobacteria bacterium]|nr:cell division protein FtsK [Actinomycetota bacterium]